MTAPEIVSEVMTRKNKDAADKRLETASRESSRQVRGWAGRAPALDGGNLAYSFACAGAGVLLHSTTIIRLLVVPAPPPYWLTAAENPGSSERWSTS